MQPHVIAFYGVTSRIRFMFLLFPQVSRNWRYESEPPLKPSPLTCYKQFGTTSIHQPSNAHIISHKTLLKHFKTLRHVSILSDHHQGAISLLKLYYGIPNSIRICKRGVVAAYHVVWACVVEQWLGVHCVWECVVEQWLRVRRMTYT